MPKIFRDILVAIIGGVITVLVLKVISKKSGMGETIGQKTVTALKTKEGAEMLLSPEGKAFVQTPEFRDLAKALTKVQAEKLLNLFG